MRPDNMTSNWNQMSMRFLFWTIRWLVRQKKKIEHQLLFFLFDVFVLSLSLSLCVWVLCLMLCSFFSFVLSSVITKDFSAVFGCFTFVFRTIKNSNFQILERSPDFGYHSPRQVMQKKKKSWSQFYFFSVSLVLAHSLWWSFSQCCTV